MKVLVTGAGGFLGSAVARRLRARGIDVRTFQRGVYPWLYDMGCEVIRGDAADPGKVEQAVAGCEVVFHVAGKAGVWGAHGDYYKSNVLGTRNVIRACRLYGIKRLIYTSSPSVVFSGRDENGIDESAPYAPRFMTCYQATKAEAEREVLAANGAQLATLALRPHLIWGPGDPHLLPRIVNKARAGRLRLLSGSRKLVDITYIDNAAHAHLCALDKLVPGAECAGRAYFISDGAPRALAEVINRLLASAGLPPEQRSIPAPLAVAAGAVLEAIYNVSGQEREPPMTRFVAKQLCCAHWYDIGAARRLLDYEPEVGIDAGMEQLKQALAGDYGKYLAAVPR